MYHDDPYDPTLETNFDTPRYAASEYSDHFSVDSRVKRSRQLAEDLKFEDKGYCKIKRPSSNTSKFSKYVDIELYGGSDIPGAKIRGAITGVKYDQYRIGTSDEYLFFKAGIATGEKGLRTNKTFFFDTPEQYEKHMRCSVDTEIKSRWYERNIQEIARRRKNDNM
jgi:hypothetical protein